VVGWCSGYNVSGSCATITGVSVSGQKLSFEGVFGGKSLSVDTLKHWLNEGYNATHGLSSQFEIVRAQQEDP
jgi:hypothetical protein